VRTVLDVRDKLAALLAGDAEARDLFGGAAEIVRKLRSAGHEAWFVGGAVRDLLLGRPIQDIDVTGSASPDEVMALFPRTVAVGESFGVVRVLVGSHQFEVALYRREEGYSDGRHPDRVSPGTLEQDVERRDFTANGLVMDPDAGSIIDLVGGLSDIDRRILRAIGIPSERMEEDYLRTLRAVRFSSCLEFDLDPATREAVAAAAPGLERISRERVRAELEKMAHGGGAVRGLELMEGLSLLGRVFPFWKSAGRRQVETALRLLARLPRRVELVEWLGAVALAFEEGLLSWPTDGRKVRERGAVLADSLRLSGDERREVEQRLLLALRMARIRGERQARRIDLYRADCFDEVLELVRELFAGRGLPTDTLAELVFERASLPPERLHPRRLLTGDDLTAAGISRGPRIGALLAECEDLAAEGILVTREDALAWLGRQTDS